MSAKFIRLAILCLFISSAAHASQVQGHLYTAWRMNHEITAMHEIIKGSDASTFSDFYRLGALGPDSTWMARVFSDESIRKKIMPGFKTPDFGLIQTIDCSHNDKAVELALNILRSAANRQDACYALGWITHWITDSHVHGLINEWGGYFFNFEGLYRHKILEAIESKHVLTKYGEALVPADYGWLSSDYGSTSGPLGGVSNLLINAFANTYQTNLVYRQNGGSNFVAAVLLGEGLAQKVSRLYYEESKCATDWDIEKLKDKLSRDGIPGFSLDEVRAVAKSATDMPSQEVYASITNPCRVTVTSLDTQLVANVQIADNKVYGRFLEEWDQATDDAVQDGATILPLCVKYLSLRLQDKDDAETEPLLASIREALLRVNPEGQLDYPHAGFTDKFRPFINMIGYPNVSDDTIDYSKPLTERILALALLCHEYFLNNATLFDLLTLHVTCRVGDTVIEKTLSVPHPGDLTDTEVLKLASTARESILLLSTNVMFSLPVPDAESNCEIRVRLDKDTNSGFRDLAVYKGKVGLDTSELLLGAERIFTFSLPSGYGGAGSFRCVGLAPHRAISLTDLPIIHKVPYYDEHRLVPRDEAFRYDIVSEETVANDQVAVRLQFTHINDHSYLGPMRVALVWLPDRIVNDEDIDTTALNLSLAAQQIMTPAQARSWLDETALYESQLNTMNLSQDEELELIQAQRIQIMKGLGVDVGDLDTSQYVSMIELDVQPVKIEISTPDEWTSVLSDDHYFMPSSCYHVYNSTNRAVYATNTVHNFVSSDSEEYKGKTLWSFEGHCEISFGANPAIETQFNARHATPSDKETQRTLKIGPFSGVAWDKVAESKSKKTYPPNDRRPAVLLEAEHLGRSVKGEALLRSGKVYLCIQYFYHGDSYRWIEFVNQRYDDHDMIISADEQPVVDGRQRFVERMDRTQAVLDAVFRTLKLVPDSQVSPVLFYAPEAETESPQSRRSEDDEPLARPAPKVVPQKAPSAMETWQRKDQEAMREFLRKNRK